MIKKPITKEQFIDLYNKHTIQELAEMLKVTRNTIRNYRDKYNLPQKRPRLIIEKE